MVLNFCSDIVRVAIPDIAVIHIKNSCCIDRGCEHYFYKCVLFVARSGHLAIDVLLHILYLIRFDVYGLVVTC
jgi:hypothetical protein